VEVEKTGFDHNKLKHNTKGLLSARSLLSGGQGNSFFITLSENLSSLDGEATVFGKIVEDENDVLHKLNNALCD